MEENGDFTGALSCLFWEVLYNVEPEILQCSYSAGCFLGLEALGSWSLVGCISGDMNLPY